MVFSPKIFFCNLCTFYVFQKITVLLQFFYGMVVVIGSLSMEGDEVMGAGVRVLGGRWGRRGRWEGVGEW